MTYEEANAAARAFTSENSRLHRGDDAGRIRFELQLAARYLFEADCSDWLANAPSFRWTCRTRNTMRTSSASTT
jgi:hypothetical protein